MPFNLASPAVNQRPGRDENSIHRHRDRGYAALHAASDERIFGLTRSWFYSAEAAGLLKLRRVRFPGKNRGVTLVRVADVECLVEGGGMD